MIEQVAEFISHFSPWWTLAVAIVLILLDWLLLQTETFTALGLGTFILAIMNALEFAPMVQFWSYTIAILAFVFVLPKVFAVIRTAKTPYDSIETMGVKGLQVYVGEIGTLKLLSNKDESTNHFFSYKDSLYQGSDISPKMRSETKITTITKVLLSDGSMHPSRFTGDSELRDGLEVRVVGVSNGALIVEEEKT